MNSDNEQIAQKLKKIREELGLTQQEVAELLNRPQSYVSRCEQGMKQLDLQDLREFSKIYKKSLNYFFENQGG